ncbi:hypothetical protein [Microbacterium halophytorum]|uniref:hypothetical protein n=1 Tax=Microbacterium halophytorum TaxID=2067568 RepID=UPI000CFACE0F|nr:hypothetical protein [Microbacterium halophytorum]
MTGEFAPRAQVVADAWLALGGGVEALSNAGGLPLARTTKLILDPLVVRPTQRPHLARALLAPDAAAELTERITAAAGDLRATSGWFACMKKQRRARRITAGNPQEKYFQRAYELARMHGEPGDGADQIAGAEVEDVHGDERVGAAELREFLSDPGVASAIGALIAGAWRDGAEATAADPTSVPAARDAVRDERAGAPSDAARDGAIGDALMTGPEAASAPRDAVPVARSGTGDDKRIDAFLDACVTGDGSAADLVRDSAGSAAGRRMRAPGAARRAGLSDLDAPVPPSVGTGASKNALPKPFDRSILERLFVPIASLEVEGTAELRGLVEREAARSAEPWQLGDEVSRVVMAAGERAGAMDDATEASRCLRARWRREGFVRRAERLGADSSEGAAEAFLRRLWARLHGRELRHQPVEADDVWDVLDGAMRSVILDRRDRVKAELAVSA